MRRTKEQIKADRELEQQIKELLSGIDDLRHNKAVVKALLLINTYQTDDELQSRQTIENNGVGFNANDATIATSYCEQLSTRYFLSAKQMVIARKIARRYWRQLVSFAKSGYQNNRIDEIVNEWQKRYYQHYRLNM